MEGDEEREIAALEGGGEGDGEGKDGERERDKSGRWIPKVRMDEVLVKNKELEGAIAQEREARIRLEEQVKALASAKPNGADTGTKIYTRAELRQMVEEQKISQDQADEYLDRVNEVRLRESVTKEVRETVTQQARVDRIKAEMARYRELAPEVLKAGSEERQKVADEYRYLVDVAGQPENVATELAALRAVFGPVERLERQRKASRERETFQDGGSDGRDGEANRGEGKTKLPADRQRYYEDLIGKGIYKGWDDPQLKKELARLPKERMDRLEKKYG